MDESRIPNRVGSNIELGVRRGVGGGGCLRGKRNWWGNLGYYCKK